MSKAFGKHLRELRTTRTKYTQTRMSELLNTDLDTYKKYETGEIEPSINRMHTLTKVLNIDFVTLLEFEEDTNIATAQK